MISCAAMSDAATPYQEYLVRFSTACGDDVPVGSFAKYKGKLIKKLDEAEFAELNDEYEKLAGHFFTSLDRGDTINDIVVKTVRDHAATLVLTSPI
jgi:hypothetical protein